jgi:hypothetical protein
VLQLDVFIEGRKVTLEFEHSLLALSKWESKSKKAFLASAMKTSDEMIDYFQCMLTSPEHDPNVVFYLTPDQLDDLANYINDSQTAHVIPPDPGRKRTGEVVTSDLVYSWMVGLKIPFHPTETWHFNRLMTLVQQVQINNEPPKKLSKAQQLSQWAEMNRRNRERFNSNG